MTAPLDDRRGPTVVIVGGGLAGTLVAANLMRRAQRPLRVVIVERSGRFGPGVAYATADPGHLLNVQAARMSAFDDEPGHLLDWVRRRIGDVGPDAYLPRPVYGAYLEALLDDERRRSRAASLRRVVGEVVRMRTGAAGVLVELRDGRALRADQVVLATGDLTAARPAGLPDHPRIIDRPWAPGALDALREGGTTALIGTGLTAIDVALTAIAGGGRAVAFSRRGLLPFTSLPGLRPPAPAPQPPVGPLSVARLERWATAWSRDAMREGFDWRDAVDGLRPVTPALWGALAPGERRRFLHSRRRTWEVRRHRMAPQTGVRVASMRAEGKLAVLTGRLVAARPGPRSVELRLAGSSGRGQLLATDRVVLCTSAGMDVRSAASPLLGDLLDSGIATADPLGLGIRSGPHGELLGDEGCEPRIRVIGALRRGDLWETTAAREIREQAAQIAADLLLPVAAASPPALAARSA